MQSSCWSFFSGVFKEYFSTPLYYECEDGHLDDAPQVEYCNNGLDHHEEEEDSKWDTSLCFLDSKFTLLDSMEKHNDIFFETLVRNRVLNSKILDEEVDVSFSNYHEHIFQDSFED